MLYRWPTCHPKAVKKFFLNFATMKKLLVIFVLMAYAIGTFGVTIERFFCCGKEITKTEQQQMQKTCCKKDRDHKKCCKEEKVSKKISGDQSPSYDQKFKFNAPVVIVPGILDYSIYRLVVKSQRAYGWSYASKPPPIVSSPLNILYCIFRI